MYMTADSIIALEEASMEQVELGRTASNKINKSWPSMTHSSLAWRLVNRDINDCNRYSLSNG